MPEDLAIIFPVSYQGNHSKNKTFTMPRAAYKRGHITNLRGKIREI